MPRRLHRTDLDAVNAALKDAYEALPRDELIREIEEGHPLTRAAALANGGDRLPAEKLPLVFRFADDNKQPRLQQAALRALRHFGEKAAIDKLADIARWRTHPLSRHALASLAASRFPAAHRRLLEILKSEPAASKKRIVNVLAMYPRPLWAETIYEFVKDPDSGVNAEALQALGVIGHPRLVDVLETSLKSRDAALRKEAFAQLLRRRDARSEALAMQYALSVMEKSPPDSQILALLNRTKDGRAIPLLLKHFRASESNRASIIDTLGRIGDETVGEELARSYSNLKSAYEKATLLRVLVKLKSPRFRRLAGEALFSRNSSLVSAACDGLRADASPQSVRLLIDAFEKSTDSTTWSYTSSSLAQIGTDDARTALVRIRDAEKPGSTRRQYAVNALKSILQRSPGYQYLYRAWTSLKQKKYPSAIDYCNFTLSIDPRCSWALSCRGHAALRQNRLKDARRDCQQALSEDPFDPYAVTGVALVLAAQGKYDAAVKLLKQRREDFTNDRVFPYHAARVYARAAAALQKSKPSPERTKKITAYRKAALDDLKQALKLGRSYSDGYKPLHAAADDDFHSLQDLPEFQQLIGPAGKKKSARKSPPEQGEGEAKEER